MSFTQYQSGRQTLSLSSGDIVVTNDGSLGVTNTYYFSIQGQNRVGLNLNSSIIAKTITPTSKVTITLPEILPGEGWLNIIISASTTNDPETLTQIVSIPRSEATTPVVLTSPEILKLTTSDRTVANPASLPSAPFQGLCRYVTSLNYYYVYDQYSTATVNGLTVLSATTGRWLQIGSINTYIEDTQDSGGCDQDVRTPNLKVISESYAVDGSKGAGTTFWIRNDYSTVIPSGTRVSCLVRLYEEDRSQLFDSLLILESPGYIDLTTGVLDVSTAIGEIPYQPKTQFLTLPEDLPNGRAMVVTVSPKFRPEHLDNQVPYLANLTTYLTFAPTTGIYAPGVFGNLIYVNDDRWRITPGQGLSVVKGKGSGLILKQELNDISQETITGLASNTADQYIFLTSNGTSFSSTDDSFVSAVKRAVVGTINGEGNATNYGGVALDSTKRLSVTVNYSNLIRSDYPDSLIMGNTSSNNATSVVIYIKNTANNYFKYEYTITPGATSETKVLNFSDFVSTTGLPTANNTFGLFKPSSVIPTTTIASSTFSSDTYIVYVSYKYNGVVTSIDHSVSDLVEANSDVSVIFSGAYSQWFSGTGTPDNSLGKNNDYYLNTSSGDVYFKDNDVYNIIFNTKGTAGNSLLSGNGIPSNSLGNDGDLYIDITNSNLYAAKSGGVWSTFISLIGATGATGQGSFSLTTSSYVQPSISSTVSVSVTSTSWLAVGQIVYITVGGYYQVSSITNSTTVVLTNLGYIGNASPSTTVTINKSVVSSGQKGDNGTNGINGQGAYATTTASYTQPSIGSNVTVSVSSTVWMAVGQLLFITNGGDYEIISITNSTTVVLKNLGYSNSVSPTTTVTTSQSVVATGLKGDMGTTGSVSSASSIILTYTTTPTTVTSELGLYADNADGLLKVRKQSNGTTDKIALLDSALWKYNLFYG